MSMKQSLQAYKMVLKKLLCKHTLCCWDTHCVCGRMSHFDFDPHTKSTQWILTSSGNSVSHIFFLKHAHGSQHEYTWKQSVDRHIDITPTFHSSFNVYTFEICQIHENNTHNKHMFFLRSLTFVVTLSLHKGKGKSCHLFLSFFFFYTNHRKTALKKTGLAVATLKLQQFSNTAIKHCTRRICLSPVRFIVLFLWSPSPCQTRWLVQNFPALTAKNDRQSVLIHSDCKRWL